MRPARTRLTLPRMNAYWLARNSAISIWFSVTPSGMFWRAIAPSVSPFFTSCCLADPASAAHGRRAARARTRGAGAAGAGAGAAWPRAPRRGGCAAGSGPRYSGGSSRNVYSRTRRPVAHDNSIRTSRNGSLTGCDGAQPDDRTRAALVDRELQADQRTCSFRCRPGGTPPSWPGAPAASRLRRAAARRSRFRRAAAGPGPS